MRQARHEWAESQYTVTFEVALEEKPWADFSIVADASPLQDLLTGFLKLAVLEDEMRFNDLPSPAIGELAFATALGGPMRTKLMDVASDKDNETDDTEDYVKQHYLYGLWHVFEEQGLPSES